MAVIPPKNDSENTKVIIGKLIEKADTAIRPVISAFNCLHSRSVNLQRLNQFTVGILESCAEFLGISLADTDNFKIFTKPSLANRLYLGFMALMPYKKNKWLDVLICIKPLIDRLRNITKQMWFSDDSATGGKLKKVYKCWK